MYSYKDVEKNMCDTTNMVFEDFNKRAKKMFKMSKTKIFKACVHKTQEIIRVMACSIERTSKEACETLNFTHMQRDIKAAITFATLCVEIEFTHFSPNENFNKQSLENIIIPKEINTMSKYDISMQCARKARHIVGSMIFNISCITEKACETLNFTNVIRELNDVITDAKQSVTTEYSSLRPNVIHERNDVFTVAKQIVTTEYSSLRPNEYID